MDELELLKKDWQRNPIEYPELSYDEIYKMSHAKSSSIVKWIFYISLIEFAFWFIIAFALKITGYNETSAALESSSTFITFAIIGYVILFYFMYKFYKNYKSISTTDSSKGLMKNILKTRNTVKSYVYFNLVFLVIGTLYSVFYVFKHDSNAKSLMESASANGEIFEFYARIIGVTLIVLVLAIAVLLVLYYLIYGILLRRLNKNYKELRKLEV